MNYTIENNKILIYGLEDFNIEHILLCGQTFRFKNQNNVWTVYSKDKKCIVKEFKDKNMAEIVTKDTSYFENYFDLKTNYSQIKQSLKNYNLPFLNEAINTFYGIRILNQDIHETFFSFMISSNNNIKRIQKIIDSLCEFCGEKIQDYRAFPTLKQLSQCSKQDFLNMGMGYRSDYFLKTLKMLENDTLENLKILPYGELKSKLLTFNGVGNKVADCILLFGYHKFESFPCDVWIEKMYNECFEKEDDRVKISKNLVNLFKNLSGYAQQYLFYYIRTQKDNKN